MKNLPLLFLGIFFTLAFSWTGLILSSHIQYGSLEPTTSTLVRPDPNNPEQADPELVPIQGVFTEIEFPDGSTQLVEGRLNPEEPELFPKAISGEAKQGKQVYISLGCMYCHSQQVRPEGFGSDQARGWGTRQSVARDYILQDRVLLGTMRTGPDLKNVGDRGISQGTGGRIWHHQHLYDPGITSKITTEDGREVRSAMPAFNFLYKIKPIGEDGPDPRAIPIPNAETLYPVPEGHEVIPTERAEDLVAYLKSLQLRYSLPEAPLPE